MELLVPIPIPPALEPMVAVLVAVLALVAVTVAVIAPMLEAPMVVELVGAPFDADVIPDPVRGPALVVVSGLSELHPTNSTALADHISQ